KKYPVRFIVQFLLVWPLTLPVIAAVSLLSDINWTRPYMEDQLEDFLKRDVSLGKVYWSLGLNGVSIETTSLTINELGGQPFLTTKRSEVSVSVLPLLKGKLVIKHLDFHNPEIWLVKKGPHSWNFDDLLVEGPEIRLLQATESLVHIVDAASDPDWQRPFDLEQVKLTLNWPRKNKRLPFFFSASRHQDNFNSTLTLEGFGKGEFTTWPDNEYSFKVTARQINPKEATRLLELLEEGNEQSKEAEGESELVSIEGLLNIDLKGQGTFNNGLKTTVALDIVGMTLHGGNIGHISAGDTRGEAVVDLSDDKLSWRDFSLKLHGIELKSSGELKQWQKEKSAIAAEIKGNIGDVKDLEFIIDPISKANTRPGGITGQIIAQANPNRLSGTAMVEIKVTGTTANTQIVTKIDTEKLQFKDVIKDARTQIPLLYIFGISPESKIRGDIRISNRDRIELVNGELLSPTGKITAEGEMSLSSSKGKIEIKADSISLQKTGINLRASRKDLKNTVGNIETSEKYDLNLDGYATARATIVTNGDNFKMDGKIDLKNTAMYLGSNSLALSSVNGQVDLHGDNRGGTMKIKTIKGNIGEGRFEVEGIASFTKKPELDITLHATSFNLKHLSGLVDLFKIQAPILSERYLYGCVKDVRMKITGTPREPKIFFSAVPNDLYYKPPGLDKPLRATAGLIVYAEDQLVLREVALVSHGNTIV
ncbi:MAG: hypothetical protein K8F91_27540, partial [Candidatus Obscuribacterales bacterium]|nr:hypothetical protein [Candidatus Obscuribacterales bacterium]